jgi:hypothetical protein
MEALARNSLKTPMIHLVVEVTGGVTGQSQVY